MSRFFRLLPWVWCAVVSGLSGCQPALNWRQLQLSTLPYWMPCRPDELRREVPLAGVRLQVEMRQCDAGGTRWALSRWAVPAGTAPEAVLNASMAQWPQAQPWPQGQKGATERAAAGAQAGVSAGAAAGADTWRAQVQVQTVASEGRELRWYRMTWVEDGQVWQATALSETGAQAAAVEAALTAFFGGVGARTLPVSAAPPHNSAHV